MTQPTAVPAPAPTPIPLRELLPYAAYAAEEGATSLVSGSVVH